MIEAPEASCLGMISIPKKREGTKNPYFPSKLVILGLLASLVILVGPSLPVVLAAPTVTQPLQLNLSTGTTHSTWTISGCSVSITTITDNNIIINPTATKSCALTITAAAPAGDVRYVTTAAATSYTVTTCSSGTCTTDIHSDYEQLQNTYQVTAAGQQTTFQNILMWGITGTQGGSNGTVCTITSNIGDSTDSCSGWSDEGTSASYPASASGSPAATRRQASGTTSFTDSSGGNTHNVAYYKQLQNTYQASPHVPTTWDASAGSVTMTGTALGVTSQSICTTGSPSSGSSTGISCTGWADYNTEVTMGVLTVITNVEQWTPATATYTDTTGGNTHTDNYYKQLQNTYAAHPSAPNTFAGSISFAVTGTYLGTSSSTICTINVPASPGAQDYNCSGYADYNLAVTLATTSGNNPNSNTRWQISGTRSFTDTTGGNTRTSNYYEQLQNTYQVTAFAQTNFDSGMTWTLACTRLGVGGACSVSSTAAPTDSSTVWADYNTAVTFPTNPSSAPASSRWQASGTSTFTDTSGGNTRNVNYYKQWTNTFSAVANAQSTFDSGLSTTVSGTILGVSSTPVCTVSPSGGAATGTCSGYIDNNQAAAFSASMSGAGADTRWQCSACDTSAQTSGGNTATINYYKQLYNTYAAATGSSVNWDSGLSAAIIGTQFGVSSQTGCAISPSSGTTTAASCSAYFDYDTVVSCPQTLSGAGSNIRWYTGSPLTYTDTTGGNTHTDTYYKQLRDAYQATPLADDWHPNTLSISPLGTYLGSAGASICTIAPTSGSASPASCTGWADYGQVVAFPSTASNGPVGARWYAPGTLTFTDTNGGNTHNVDYYDQVGDTYQIVPLAQTTWDSGLTFTVTGTVFGVPNTTICTVTPPGGGGSDSCQGEGDVSTTVYVTVNPTGAPANSKWQLSGPSSFTQEDTADTHVLNFYKQWANNWNYAVLGGSPAAPALSCNSLGSTVTLALTTSNQAFYCDNNAAATATDPVTGGSGERWSNNGQSQTVTSGGNSYTFNEYHQYQFILSYSNTGGGSMTAPVLTATQYGSAYTPSLGTSGTAYWLDSSQSWSVANPTTGSTSSERWYSDGVVSGTVSATSPTTAGGGL